MTVKELFEVLEKIEDKNKEIFIISSLGGFGEIEEIVNSPDKKEIWFLNNIIDG